MTYRSVPGIMAGADLSSHQYHAVRMDSTAFRVVVMTNANAQKPFGILQDDPNAANQPADVAYDGVCKAELGGTITVGADLAVNNDGELIADVEVADGGAIDLHHIAVALEAGVDGDIVKVLLHMANRVGLE